MPIPLILGGIAVIAGMAGAKKAYDAHEINQQANRINEKANDLIKRWKGKVDKSREKTDTALKDYGQYKLDVWTKTMKDFAETFGQIHNIDFSDRHDLSEFSNFVDTQETLQEFKDRSIEFKDVALGLTGAGAAGGLTALGAYSAVGLLASASTGTAIGTLSGVAATNATLAWLGGGSLAAGGLGIAGGTAVLGGLIAGPALLVLGLTMGNKAEQNLEEAKENKAKAKAIKEELKTVVNKCDNITKMTILFHETAHKLGDGLLKTLTLHMGTIIEKYGTDFRDYPENCKEIVAMALKTALTLKTLLDVSILEKDGSINSDAEHAANEAEGFIEPTKNAIYPELTHYQKRMLKEELSKE